MLCYLAAGIGVFLWLRRKVADAAAAPARMEAQEAPQTPQGASPDLDGLPDVSVDPVATRAPGPSSGDLTPIQTPRKGLSVTPNPFREAKRRPGSLDDILPPGEDLDADEQEGLDSSDGAGYDPDDQSV